jgi:hypothetical protein
MIYPDVTTEEWTKRHPDLEVEHDDCPECGTIRVLNIPFIKKDWVGLASKPCECGCPPAVSQVTRPGVAATWIENLYYRMLETYK